MSDKDRPSPPYEAPIWSIDSHEEYNTTTYASTQQQITGQTTWNAPILPYHGAPSYNPCRYGPVISNITAHSENSDIQSQPAPFVRINEYSPRNCHAADTFTVRFSSPQHFHSGDWKLTILFGWYPSPGGLTFVGHDDVGYAYALQCQVPNLAEGYTNPTTTCLDISSQACQASSQLPIGPIHYNIFGATAALQSAAYDWGPPARRPLLQPYQPPHDAAIALAQPSASYPPYPSYALACDPQYGYPVNQPHLTASFPYQSRDQQQSYYSRGAPAESRAYMPRTGGQQTEGYRISKRYARTPEPTSSRNRTMPVTSGSTNPPLVRTSTLRAPKMPRANNQLQPFSQYSYRRSDLRLVGDLAGMANNWTAEEKKEKRRLVEFERKQDGSVLTVTHKPVTVEDRAEDGICVNCIRWEETDEMFITSVDSLHLLELLVGNRFPVEEKNRIRRNLEGFKPRTILREDKNKKHINKEDEEMRNDAFFNVIMGFADPKPRNIEKDIKVFPWKLLPEMLKKILSKFSASYSSIRGQSASSPSSDHDLSESPPGSASSLERPGPTSAVRSNTTSSRATPAPPRNPPLLRLQTSSPDSTASPRPGPTPSYVSSELSPQARSLSSWEIELQRQTPWVDQYGSFDTSEILATPEVVAGAAESPADAMSHGDALRDYEGPHESSWGF